MRRIYTWDAEPAERNLTAADIRALKGRRKLVQTTANSAVEALAAEYAELDLIMCNCENVSVVRGEKGSKNLFLTAAIALPDYVTADDVLRAAFKALKEGADSVYTARGPHIVEMLAREDIPVMGHLGLVPRKSTWRGGLRAIGKTADEAYELFKDFKRLEDAGGFSVEAEVIVDRVMAEISPRTGLFTVSLGSGPGADAIYLFQSDICGEQNSSPRHARTFGDLARDKQGQISERNLKPDGFYDLRAEKDFESEYTLSSRKTALQAFRAAAISGDFPNENETAKMPDEEYSKFQELLEKHPKHQ